MRKLTNLMKKDPYQFSKILNSFKRYTNDEDKLIIENYKKLSDKELAEKLGRTIKSIQNRRSIINSNILKAI